MARMFCKWQVTIEWNNGKQSTMEGISREDAATEHAEDWIETEVQVASLTSTGDVYPAEIRLRLYDFHAEEVE